MKHFEKSATKTFSLFDLFMLIMTALIVIVVVNAAIKMVTPANITSRCVASNTRVWETSKSDDFQMWYDETCK